MSTRLLSISSTLALVVSVGFPFSAQAQEAGSVGKTAASSAKSTEVVAADNVQAARTLWKEGVDAFQKGDFETARVAFARCYAFMPKPDVLRNLSISEVESGHYVSAAQHLTQLLNDGRKLSAKVKARLEELLARSQAQVGRLAISSTASRPEVWVDGEKLRQASLEGPYYVKPGRHTVRVKTAAHDDQTRRVYAMAGVSIPVDFIASAPPPPPRSTLPSLSAQSRQTPPPLSDVAGGLSTPATIAVAAGGALTALSLATATYFTAASYQHGADADLISGRLRWRMGGSSSLCGDSTPFASDCARLGLERRREARDAKRATAAFIGFGITGAATLTYALILAISEKEDMLSGFTPTLDVQSGGASFALSSHF